jgi:hypothetical protein
MDEIDIHFHLRQGSSSNSQPDRTSQLLRRDWAAPRRLVPPAEASSCRSLVPPGSPGSSPRNRSPASANWRRCARRSGRSPRSAPSGTLERIALHCLLLAEHPRCLLLAAERAAGVRRGREAGTRDAVGDRREGRAAGRPRPPPRSAARRRARAPPSARCLLPRRSMESRGSPPPNRRRSRAILRPARKARRAALGRNRGEADVQRWGSSAHFDVGHETRATTSRDLRLLTRRSGDPKRAQRAELRAPPASPRGSWTGSASMCSCFARSVAGDGLARPRCGRRPWRPMKRGDRARTKAARPATHRGWAPT